MFRTFETVVENRTLCVMKDEELDDCLEEIKFEMHEGGPVSVLWCSIEYYEGPE